MPYLPHYATPGALKQVPTSNQPSPQQSRPGKGAALSALIADAASSPVGRDAASPDSVCCLIQDLESLTIDAKPSPALLSSLPQCDVIRKDDIAHGNSSSHPAVGRDNLTHALPPRSTFPVLGPFDVQYRIQVGGFGTAWAAKDRGTGFLLCIKQFRPLEEPGAQKSAWTEFRVFRHIAASRVGQRGKHFIMQLNRSMQHGGTVFFAMELLACDLAAYLYNEPGKGKMHARRWTAQIALGIDSLHEMGIIHRDIKCENILIDPRENVRIIDFGLSHLNCTRKPLRRGAIYTDEYVGTMQYMAPEIFEGRNVAANERRFYGAAVDWWALGCILFELESDDHEVPFLSAKDINEYISWSRGSQRFQPHPRFEGLGVVAVDLLMGLLQVMPSLRFSLEDMERHVYFLRRDGTSEFDNAVGRALGRHICPELIPQSENESGSPVKVIQAAKMGADYDLDLNLPRCPLA